jgi:hypothetical protein
VEAGESGHQANPADGDGADADRHVNNLENVISFSQYEFYN